MLDADLRHLLDKKQLIIKITVEDTSRYLAFDDGKVMLLKRFSATPTLALTFKGAKMMASTIGSAAVGDNFWLTALRDRRVHLVGDMGILIWFFGLCRHLPWRRGASIGSRQ